MSKRERLFRAFQDSADPICFLKDHSALPGPRANLELLEVVMENGNESLFLKCLQYTPDVAPGNTPVEFVAMCGAAGLGNLIANGQTEYFPALRKLASDPRWRVREGVAFGLQRIGNTDFNLLFNEMEHWAEGNPYEQRAVVAGLCEPGILRSETHAMEVLNLVTNILVRLDTIRDRNSEGFRVLAKGLGYGLSIVIVSLPGKGKAAFESLISTPDKDVRKVLLENLKKNRMEKMDPEWTHRMRRMLE